jgi:hypothetical protein
MNTVGKILVILNFLFAVVVGAFLVVDFVARANWKTAYEDQQKKFEVLRADREQHVDDANKLRTDLKDLTFKLEKAATDLDDQAKAAKVEANQLDLKRIEAENQAKDADLTLQKALGDIERLKVSEGDLKKIIKDREQSILTLQDEVKKYRTEAIASDQLAKQVSDRNQELLDQISKLTLALERSKAGLGGADGPSLSVRGNEPNPPATMVKGKVDRVDAKDSTLVQISLGTDQGVNKGNTMEVFRTAPAPKYLGMIRILDAEPRRAIGRLIVPAGASRPQLLEGDLVWSRLK